MRLPLAGVTTARLEVPNEQGGSRIAFTVEFTPRTEFARDAGRIRNDQLVVLEGVLGPGRLRVRRLHEVDIAEYGGRIALRDGPLDLPVVADRLVEIFLDGAPSLPVTFLLTPQDDLTAVEARRWPAGNDRGRERPPRDRRDRSLRAR